MITFSSAMRICLRPYWESGDLHQAAYAHSLIKALASRSQRHSDLFVVVVVSSNFDNPGK